MQTTKTNNNIQKIKTMQQQKNTTTKQHKMEQHKLNKKTKNEQTKTANINEPQQKN